MIQGLQQSTNKTGKKIAILIMSDKWKNGTLWSLVIDVSVFLF